MVTMITLHVFAAETRDQGITLVTKNTELARKAPGFVSRDLYVSVNDPLKAYSITTWETREDLERFRRNPERPQLVTEGEEHRVYEKTANGLVLLFTSTDSDVFELIDVP